MPCSIDGCVATCSAKATSPTERLATTRRRACLSSDGPIVLTPALQGGLLVSLRGGDSRLTVGQDFALGYLSHTDTSVTFFLEETFTFVPAGAEAAVPLLRPAAKGKSR